MRTQTERNQLQQLISSPQWRTLEMVAKELCDKYNGDTKIRDTEWETLSTTLLNEGKVRGVEQLLQTIITEAHGDE